LAVVIKSRRICDVCLAGRLWVQYSHALMRARSKRQNKQQNRNSSQAVIDGTRIKFGAP